MTDEEILKKMAGMLLDNNKKLLTAVDKSIEKEIQASEERLTEKLGKRIDDSQKDTIDTLSELMHSGYGLHEKRIQRLEGELNLPPLKPKH
jgi:hypothetical protein